MAELSVAEQSTDDSGFKPQLVPLVRVVAHTPGVDLAQRIRDSIAGFLPASVDPDSHLARTDPAGGLLDVPDPAPLYAALSPAARTTLQNAAAQLLRTVEAHLVAPLGTVSRLEVSCLTSTQSGLAAGTVVLVRESEVVTEQYAFPYVRVDVASGRIAPVVLPTAPRPAPPTTMQADVADNWAGNTESVCGAMMAVTPFLPPPFGPALTAALAFTDLVLPLVQDSGKTPLDLAKQSIENYIKDNTLGQLAGKISGPANEFANMAQSEKEDLGTLSAIDGGIAYMRDRLEDKWTPAVITANNQLYEVLKTCDVTNYDGTLTLLSSGITTELLMYHAQVAIGAVDASIQYRHQDLDKYGQAVSTWTTVAETAATDIGTTHDGDWTDQQITNALGRSTSYLPRIEAWMAKAKRDRLGQISATTRRSYWQSSGNTGFGHIQYGWTFTDDAVDGDHGSAANSIDDTPGSGCCADPVQHQDDVQKNRTAYVAKIAAGVDSGFSGHRQVMASWATYISDLLALLPPAVPPTPKVLPPPPPEDDPVPPFTDPPPPLPATPSGDWITGHQVRYALMARSTKGPSPASDWSQPLTIGATVGAIVDGITAVDGADTIVVIRQFRSDSAAQWSDSEQVAALPSGEQGWYTDTSTGGDPW